MRVLPLALMLAAAPALPAQQGIPKRPTLPADADTNDARAYFDWGQDGAKSWKDAHDAFYWATRLDPSQPMYQLAQFRALWFRQPEHWRAWYRAGHKGTLDSKAARELYALDHRVMLQDPFPQLPLQYCYLDPRVERLRDVLIQGVVYFDLGCFEQSADKLGQALARDPGLFAARVDRGRALVYAERYSEAAAELQVALDTLRARDIRVFRFEYESHEFLEYAIGEVHRRARKLDAAAAAYGRALTENLGFHMAHVRLAELARRRGQPFEAAREYAAAVDAGGDGAVLHHDYGVVLLEVNRAADAEAQLRRAVELEPFWASAHFHLARALDAQDRSGEALTAYESFLALVPRKLVKLRNDAEQRRAALREGGS